MSQKLHLKTILLFASALLSGIILGPFIAGLYPARQPLPAALEPDSPQTVYVCTPAYIGAFKTRVHVRCTVAAAGGIIYFAAPTSDSKNAARILSIMLTAKALGKNLQVYYTATASGASFGCQTGDCRPIDAIEMTP